MHKDTPSVMKNLLTCAICNGYLIDAATLVECLHSFCKSCILHHLESSYNCPKCKTEIHKTKPLEHIRSDPSLQEIVYKLVPNLFAEEERRKEQWEKEYDKREDDPGPSNIGGNEDSRILVTFKYFRGTSRMERIKTEQVLQLFPTRYLCCQPEMPVRVLKKFALHKFDIATDLFEIDLWRGDETLRDELTLKQLVQIYGLFRERKPLELHFSLYPKFDPSTNNANLNLKTPVINGNKNETVHTPDIDEENKVKTCSDTTELKSVANNVEETLEAPPDANDSNSKSNEEETTNDTNLQMELAVLNENTERLHINMDTKIDEPPLQTDQASSNTVNELNPDYELNSLSNDMDTS